MTAFLFYHNKQVISRVHVYMRLYHVYCINTDQLTNLLLPGQGAKDSKYLRLSFLHYTKRICTYGTSGCLHIHVRYRFHIFCDVLVRFSRLCPRAICLTPHMPLHIAAWILPDFRERQDFPGPRWPAPFDWLQLPGSMKSTKKVNILFRKYHKKDTMPFIWAQMCDA